MQQTLLGEEFRGMFPYLVYSARVFQVLAQSREYAEALVMNDQVLPMLLQIACHDGAAMRVESDLEGRCLALRALCSIVEFGLWGADAKDEPSRKFFRQDLGLLLNAQHRGIRRAAARLCIDLDVLFYLLVARRLQDTLPLAVWKRRVLAFIFPFLDCCP